MYARAGTSRTARVDLLAGDYAGAFLESGTVLPVVVDADIFSVVNLDNVATTATAVPYVADNALVCYRAGE